MLTKVQGFFKIEGVRIVNGKEIKRTISDWFPNLVTDAGLDYSASNYSILEYCHVGSGSTAPTVADIGLDTFIAAQQGGYQTPTVNATSPYYISHIVEYHFAIGAAAGNLSEIGIGWASSGTTLFSRALILDASSTPTTITVLSDEYLYVTYEHRFYPSETDATGSIVFTGSIGGTYTYTLRPAKIDTIIPTPYGSPVNRPLYMNYIDSSYMGAYDGSIGIITSLPTGNQVALNTTLVTIDPYIDGSFTSTYTLLLSPVYGNLAAGIKSLMFIWGPNYHQIEFGTAIPKTDVDSLSLTFTQTWDRV